LNQIKGVDLSHNNPGTIQVGEMLDWTGPDDEKLRVFGIKAAQGVGFTDPTFAERRQQFHEACATRGLRLKEAPCVDVEQAGDNAGITLDWWRAVKANYGLVDDDMWLYGSYETLVGLLGDGLADFAGGRFWGARYDAPSLGETGPLRPFIWQYGQYGIQQGAGSGDVDTDLWIDPSNWPEGVDVLLLIYDFEDTTGSGAVQAAHYVGVVGELAS